MKPNIFSDKMSYFEWIMIFNAEKMSLGLREIKKSTAKGGFRWPLPGSNGGPSDYESGALTN